MIGTLMLWLNPGKAWQKIAGANPSVGSVLLLTLLPWLLSSSAAESCALTTWGEIAGPFGRLIKHSPEVAIRFGLTQLVAGLGIVFGGAKLIHSMAHSFHFYPRYRACFTLSAYTFTPVCGARFLDCLPMMDTWLCWGAGVLGMVYVLYQGIGVVLKPEQTKGFGMYLLSVVTFTFLSGLGHILARMVLEQRLLI